MYFYIGQYRIEIRQVKTKHRWNRSFLFIKFFIPVFGSICKKCPNGRPKYKYCNIGIEQHNRKSCFYQKREFERKAKEEKEEVDWLEQN